jgi:hypothetical protein
MIKTILVALSVALIVPLATSCVAPEKGPRAESAMNNLQEVWLTQSQAQRLLASIDTVIKYVKELHEQNKAPRPGGAQPCDPAFPGCGMCDLTAVMECLCQIKLQLMCICEEQQSVAEDLASCCAVIGTCEDPSTLLDSVVDKSDIDEMCLTVVSLLKTILLELRGAFTVV